MNLVGADVLEPAQYVEQFVVVAGKSRRRRHRIDELRRDPVHVSAHVPVDLGARPVAVADGEPE
jgi:hypothetical protein